MEIIENSDSDLEYQLEYETDSSVDNSDIEYEKVNDNEFNINNFYSVVKSSNKLKTKLKKIVEKNSNLKDELESIKVINNNLKDEIENLSRLNSLIKFRSNFLFNSILLTSGGFLLYYFTPKQHIN